MSRQNRPLAALAFLTPNILGVLMFTVFPVVFSLVMAFTNWDLKRHNMFSDQAPHFVGLDNLAELFTDERSWRFLGNTLFFMMGIPFAVAGSLGAAMLLSSDTRAGGGRPWLWTLATAGLVAGCGLMAALGAGMTATAVLLVGVFGGVFVLGAVGGVGFYRTLFYTPNFVAGVATYILWKKIYNSQTGPVNTALEPVLGHLAAAVNATPAPLVQLLAWVAAIGMLLLLAYALAKLRTGYLDGELGPVATLIGVAFLGVPVVVAATWQAAPPPAAWLFVPALALAMWHGALAARATWRFPSRAATGFGTAVMLALMTLVGMFALLGMSAVAWRLPALASDGLEPPRWLTDYHWAKPALMIMSFWAAVGSNNMLLYLAALTNVPGELYEAADIDGAGRRARFWHVTWPQLAPTTFFILVMSMIAGLQGGFEMARVMTDGGPAGATTTLSYYTYIEGFKTGRLGFASAIAWALFLLILSITLINWKFGNRYVNE